jgi:acyl-CoA thioesterase II
MELETALRVERDGDAFAGVAPGWWGPSLFGGFILGQAIHAAGQTVAADRRIQSLHAYFVRPARSERELRHRIITERDGRSVSQRRLETLQEGEVIFWMACSYSASAAEPVVEQPLHGSVPDPAQQPAESARAWDVVRVPPGTRAWFRLRDGFGDDALLNDAVLGFFSDLTGVGGNPIVLPDVEDWISLDHAVWFHRSPRADGWLFYDVETVVAAPKRALIRGTMYGADRRPGLTVMQDALLRRAGPTS